MREIDFHIHYLKKLFPLRISRGLRVGADNLFVSVTDKGLTGWGETSPGVSEGAADAKTAESILRAFVATGLEGLSTSEIYNKGKSAGLAPCVQAALDIALWDLDAKIAGNPLYQHLNIPLPRVPTSVTIGILPEDEVEERVHILLNGTGARALKIKLGSIEGIEKDKAMYSKVLHASSNYDVQLRVDANGGWSVEDAKHMMQWIAERKADYIEQPLKEGNEDGLPYLFENRPLPIFIDESCRYVEDVSKWHEAIDGVNLKLMKCGGITEGLRILAEAKKLGLKTMIGCMGESSISISAGAAISGIIDHIDLDSHLNLDPDPCEGAAFMEGIITPNNKPGHGASFKI